METKFTQGPWSIDNSKAESGELCVVVADNTPCNELAAIFHSDECCSLEQSQADAYLISAAPDLYRELDDIVSMLEAIPLSMFMALRDEDGIDLQNYIDDALEALKKARGEV